MFFNAGHFHLPLAERAVLDPWRFAGACLSKLMWKWPAAEGVLRDGLALLAVTTPLPFASVTIGQGGAAAPMASAYMAVFAVTLGAQLAFAWSAFSTIGDLSIAQACYHNVLWPGFALAGAATITWLARRWRGVTAPALGLYLLPTIPGAMLVTLFPWR